MPSIRSRSSHEQHVEREHVQLTLDVDQAGERRRVARGARPAQAIVDSYPRDAADRVESLERDVERFRANAESWSREAERARGELAALGPFASAAKQANELTSTSTSASAELTKHAGRAQQRQAKLAEIHDGPDSPQRWEAEHPDAREQLREAEQHSKTRCRARSRPRDPTPAKHLTRVLGERPSDEQPVERDTWEQGSASSRALPHHLRDRPGRADRARSRTRPSRSPGAKARRLESAGKQVLEAREQLDLERPGYGPTEERMARVLGSCQSRTETRSSTAATAGSGDLRPRWRVSCGLVHDG